MTVLPRKGQQAVKNRQAPRVPPRDPKPCPTVLRADAGGPDGVLLRETRAAGGLICVRRIRSALLCAAALCPWSPAAADAAPSTHVQAFWDRVAQCETGGRWDWGARHRPAEGHTYEGGVGFYTPTWHTWAAELHLLGRYPHAYLAPRLVQIRVAEYGLTVHQGYWGCLQ